ncbi:IS66 family transposase [Tahibacter amnicola]|uniref:IS66 family transposase n=1 Tax=Tahibacter amnicola TaxID=2976241 RepID=A0ABY6BGK4_9GAMM|nr:IS66 family transposase [Tahibacter amnicola]UXI68210.1 IS66 family transposase [Tahibacter amnicola]
MSIDTPATDDLQAQLRAALAALAERDTQIAARDALLSQRDAQIIEMATVGAYREARIKTLESQLAEMNRRLFGRRSEQLDPAQRLLFEEAFNEDVAAIKAELETLKASPSPSSAPRQPKRLPLPEHLPRVEVRHEPASCACAACGGTLTPMGEDVSEQLDCEPAKFFVRRHVYPKYACRACDTVTATPSVPNIIERGRFAPAFIAHLLVGKYADHVPFYRQQQIYARSGIELARSTMTDTSGAVGVALMPLVAAMKADLLGRGVIHADETPLAMLDPGAGKTARAYLFAYTSAHGPPITIFDFCTSRSGENARRFLGPFRGHLVVDDYSGYKALFGDTVTEVGCWAHIRRRFFELHAAKSSAHAEPALRYIAELYRIEAQAKGLDPPERQALRQQHARPILDAFQQWISEVSAIALPNSGLAKELAHTRKRWPALIRYVDDGTLPIDNNPVERSIRPIALGRKNWMFAGSKMAGERAAAIMSLIATAKQNGHEPFAYLKDVLTRLPTHPNSRIAELLPHRWQPVV